jgi:adenylate cyclase
VSEEVVGKLDGFLLRDVGKFRLKGKMKPIAAYELIGRRDTAEEEELNACAIFAGAMSAFSRQSWDEAKEKFGQVIEILGHDGPSVFYIRLCERYEENQPGEPWDGVVTMGSK